MRGVAVYTVLFLGLILFSLISRTECCLPHQNCPIQQSCPSQQFHQSQHHHTNHDNRDEGYKPNAGHDLGKVFDDHLIGQPLAQRIVLAAVRGHVITPVQEKPLVLSLHGPAGTGKNHISRLVVKSLFKKGMASECVTARMSTSHFPHQELLREYQEELVYLVKYKVASCPEHVFIFDEVENMPVGLLDSLKSFLDHHDNVDGIDFRKTIFIFRSDLAATAINKYVWESFKRGTEMEDIPLVDMERIIMNEVSQKIDAGFYQAKIISSHLVSHFIPFFPLQKSHVRQCIRAEFKARGKGPDTALEDEILAQLQFDGPGGSRVFAVKGCKNVADKVDIILYAQNMRHKRLSIGRTDL